MKKIEIIKEVLSNHFDFRFNVLTGSIDFKAKTAYNYLPMTDIELKKFQGLIYDEKSYFPSDRQVIRIMESFLVKEYNPVQYYFADVISKYSLQEYNGSINALAATVISKDPDAFKEDLYYWLHNAIQSVREPAKVLHPFCFNICGPQGTFKSTWIDLLIPDELKRHSYSGLLPAYTLSDIDRILTSNFILNIDKNPSKLDQEILKYMLTLRGEVNLRRPYQSHFVTLPRIANLISSCNEIPSDQESRRIKTHFIETIDIETAKSIDINKVWAEAYYNALSV